MRWSRTAVRPMLPAEADAEEVGAPEHAQVLPGVVEPDIEVATAVIQPTTERQALQILLVA